MKKKTRQEASAEERETYYLTQIKAAPTEVGRLWKACAWLIVEARRAHRLAEVMTLVLGAVVLVRERLPLPKVPHAPGATPSAPHVQGVDTRRKRAA